MPGDAPATADAAARPFGQTAGSIAELRAALADAHLPTLAVVVAQLTGEDRWIEAEKPVYAVFGGDQGGLSDAFGERLRAAALEALEGLAAGRPLPPPPGPDRLRRMMDFIAGAEIPERYGPFLLEELAIDGVDRKRPDWSEPRLREAALKMKVLIIGAGMSGLLTALRLQQAGIDFEIVEKNSDVGGTWLENRYPGVRVDTPNHLYSFSFEPNHAWPMRYSTGDVLLAYFQDVAEKHALRSKIRFETAAVRCRYDEEAQVWRTTARGPDGRETEIVSTAVVSAVGQLNIPRYPDIEGRDSFRGEAFHSARWPKGFDPKGKDVAVIGTGASAFQFVPEIAPKVRSLTVYQRTPPWLAPTSDYHDPVAAGKKALLEHLPFYDRWYRFYLFWTMTDGVYEAVKADEDWTGGPEAVGQMNAGLGEILKGAIQAQTAGREDLAKAAIPAYPFGGKRALRDNGVWIAALRRDNVTVVTTPIRRIVEDGVETEDGARRAAEVLIYGTGFKASDFLSAFDVVGRDGRSLHAVWNGDARAYLGVLHPGFPNFFSLYGPNTNIVVNGSIIFFSECAVRYVLGCLELQARAGAGGVEVRTDVFEAFNARVDAANAKMAWGAAQVSSWYKNDKGRVSQNWPFPLVDYWSATLEPKAEELTLLAPRESA